MQGKNNIRHEMDSPIVFARKQSNEILVKQIRALAFHAGVFLYWIVASHLLVDLFLILGAIMWVLGAITAYAVPNERENTIRNTHRFMLAYSSLVGYKLILTVITRIPESEWSRALGVNVGSAFVMTASNYLQTMFAIMAIGIPVAFVVAMGSTFFTFRSSVDVRERTEQIIRTGEQRTLSDRMDSRKR